MIRRVRIFWRGLCTNAIGTAGVVLTTSGFLLFVFAEFLRITGIVTNAYVGLVTYLALPAVFVLGLLLIPMGWWLYRRSTGKSTREILSERFDPDFIEPRPVGSRLVATIAVFTLVNIAFLGIGGSRMLHFMDQPVFCGTACHTVMNPEWTVYQDSPHARVRCVDCHVGEGAEAMVDAKLNGIWQMISATFKLYERPIPTPVHNLRPARETCERCHWPEAFYGNRIKRIVHYDDDIESTPRYSTLALKIGSGTGEARGEIHWHIAERNEVRYQSADETRMAMRWVEVRQPDGTYKRYTNRRGGTTDASSGETKETTPAARVLDCVDCHNRATHVYEEPRNAVDRRIASGRISRTLPFARRQAVAALTGSYRPDDSAVRSVENDFRGFYARLAPEEHAATEAELDQAVDALQAAYRRNIHPAMKVEWNVYANHLGHKLGPGCRRCHSPDMTDDDGNAVPNECTLCHSILAYESGTPFQFLGDPGPEDPEAPMHEYLRREFLGEPAPPQPFSALQFVGALPLKGDPEIGRRGRPPTEETDERSADRDTGL